MMDELTETDASMLKLMTETHSAACYGKYVTCSSTY